MTAIGIEIILATDEADAIMVRCELDKAVVHPTNGSNSIFPSLPG